MDDSHQIDVPPSFTELFTTPGGHRLTATMAHVRERYELCEDMAQMLTEQASNTLHALGITELDVLEKMAEVLSGEHSPVQPLEGRWVVRRLAEILYWPDPGPGPGPGPVA